MRIFTIYHATITAFFLLLQFQSMLFADSKPATQGQFAVSLSKELGLGNNLSEEKAIELLSSLSILPVLTPNEQWEKDKQASEKFVAEIQASIQMLLKKVAIGLGITPPPTLELFIFEIPPTPQHVYFHADAQLPDAKNQSEVAPPGPVVPFEPMPEQSSTEPRGIPDTTERPRVQLAEHDLNTADMFLFNYSMQNSDPDIVAQLVSGGRVPVIVTLREPKGLPSGLDVMRLISDLVAGLSENEFQVKRMHQSIPGFSGFLLNESGLKKLIKDSRVLRIEIDQADRTDNHN